MIRQRRKSRSTSRGFTLLEVLTALALSVLLIAAIYSGLDLYYRYSESGREEVERAQLTRAVLRQIEKDLRCVVYHPPESSGSSAASTSSSGSTTSSGSSSTGSSGTSGSSTTTTITATAEDAGVSATSGLFGDATTLMLHVSHPTRLQTTATASNLPSHGSDLLTVSYFVGGTGSGSLQNLVKSPGLQRMQGERLAMSMADEQSNMSALASTAESIAPEVVSIRFRYFDGFNWRENWDSSAFAGLPLAVEVQIELTPPTQGTRQQGSEAAPLKYTTVVALPLGQPNDTSTIPQ